MNICCTQSLSGKVPPGKFRPGGLGLGARVRNPSNPNPSNPNPSNPNPSNPNPKTQGGRFLGGLFLGGIFPGGTFPKTTQSWPSLLFAGGITEFTVKPETVAKWVLNRAFPRQIQCISQENVFVPLKLTSQTI